MTNASNDNSLLVALYDYWQRKRGGRVMPDRSDIDPVDMPKALLPYLFMVDLFGTPARWRYRLMGTEMAARLGTDLTGRYLDDVLGSRYCGYLIAINNEIYDAKRPLYTESLLRLQGDRGLLTKRLLVPLAHPRTGGAMILGAQTYHGGNSAPQHSLVRSDRHDIDIEELEHRSCQS